MTVDLVNSTNSNGVDSPNSRGGPQTAAGKDASKRNALQHGYAPNTVEVPHAERKAYEEFRKGYHLEMAPNGRLETTLVDRIARNSWKLERIAVEQDRVFDLQCALQTAALTNGDETVAAEIRAAEVELLNREKLLARYEQAAERNLHKALAVLAQHRKNPELFLPDGPALPTPSRATPPSLQTRTIPAAPIEPPKNRFLDPQTSVKPIPVSAANPRNLRR